MDNPSASAPMGRPSLIHLLEWAALRLASGWIVRGDMPDAHRRAWRLSRVGRLVLRKEWAWARTNLRLIYGPDPPQELLDRLARRVFGNIFCSYLEGLRCTDMIYRDEGFQHVREAHALGRGLILCSIHMGSWETGLRRVVQNGIPLAVVYRPASNPLSEQEFLRARREYGVEWVKRKDPRHALRVLQERRTLGLMVDINTRDGAITAPFLGLPAQCPAGPARLAMRFRVPIVPILSIREGPDQAQLVALPAIEPQEGAATPEREAALTTRINQAFEPWVHRHADQYNWLHARWRSRADGALWRPDDPLEQMWKARQAPFPPLAEELRALLAE